MPYERGWSCSLGIRIETIDKHKTIELWSCRRQIESRGTFAECIAVYDFGRAGDSIRLHGVAIAVDFAHRAVVAKAHTGRTLIRGEGRGQVILFPLSIGVVLANLLPNAYIRMPSQSQLARPGAPFASVSDDDVDKDGVFATRR